MRDGAPSRTALGAALHRAAHQVVDGGRVFPDPVAVPVTGWSVEDIAARAAQDPGSRPLRTFIAMRHAVGRDEVDDAVAAGARQVLVLGAGLDTTAYQPQQPAADLRVIEVDHPSTQAWKLERVRAAGLVPTCALEHVPVDFEAQSWLEQVTAHGLDLDAPVVVLWLGVVPYLSLDAVGQTVRSVAALAPASRLVLDYGEPGAAGGRRLDARVARAGEPVRTRLQPARMHELVTAHGLAVDRDLGVSALAQRFLGVAVADRPGGHVLVARPAPR